MKARRRRRTPCGGGASPVAAAAVVTWWPSGAARRRPPRSTGSASALDLRPLLAPDGVVDAGPAPARAVREWRLPERDRAVERWIVHAELVAEALEPVRRVGYVEVLA